MSCASQASSPYICSWFVFVFVVRGSRYAASKRQLPETVIRRITLLGKRSMQASNRPQSASAGDRGDRFQLSSNLMSNSFAVGFLSARSEAADDEQATVTVASGSYNASASMNMIESMAYAGDVTEAVTVIPSASPARQARLRQRAQRPRTAPTRMQQHGASAICLHRVEVHTSHLGLLSVGIQSCVCVCTCMRVYMSIYNGMYQLQGHRRRRVRNPSFRRSGTKLLTCEN